jgi:aspartate racemase
MANHSARRVGLVGGLGPESTIDYYRRILALWQAADPSSAPAVLIDSLDVQLGIRLVATDRVALADYLLDSIARLAAAGADFVALAANTPHVVFDTLRERAAVPLLSIVETCVEEALRLGYRRLALLGTRFTMEAPFYPEVFGRHGLEIVIPDEAERTWLHERYLGELLKGDFRDETRRGVEVIVRHLHEASPLDAVILGGTELPLLLRGDQVAGLPGLDTTELHVAAIVSRLLKDPTREELAKIDSEPG